MNGYSTWIIIYGKGWFLGFLFRYRVHLLWFSPFLARLVLGWNPFLWWWFVCMNMHPKLQVYKQKTKWGRNPVPTLLCHIETERAYRRSFFLIWSKFKPRQNGICRRRKESEGVTRNQDQCQESILINSFRKLVGRSFPTSWKVSTFLLESIALRKRWFITGHPE